MSPAWFLAALLPMFVSHLLRLQYHDAAGWISWDYAGRLCALAVLAAIPAACAIAFRREARRLPPWKVGLWVVGIALASVALIGLERPINAALPMTVLGQYPRSTGWLHLVDVTFGLALVAFSEEIMFRRLAREMLCPWLGDRALMVLATSLMFGAYHWWAGPAAMTGAAICGLFLMVLYQRSGALWPVGLAHYLVDLYFFA